MNKLSKIIGWVLGIIGVVLGIMCLANGESNPSLVDVILRYSYVLLIAAVVILLGLAIIMAAKNDPKSLIKGLIVLVGIAVLVAIAYALASGDPVPNIKNTQSASMLKLTDTMLLLTYILGGAAIVAIFFGVIRNAIKNK